MKNYDLLKPCHFKVNDHESWRSEDFGQSANFNFHIFHRKMKPDR